MKQLTITQKRQIARLAVERKEAKQQGYKLKGNKTPLL